MSPHELGDVRDDVCSISLRKGKWLYSDRLYKGSGARRSAETPNPRHSGLDPESSVHPFMDPGSMSPHELGDVRDDVCSISLRKGKWLYSDRLYKGSGARRSAETPNPRHSGLDPESSVHPFMDPGSMSPHELGDVRDDVCSISLRKGKWLYSDRLYKGSGARRSAETPKSTSFRA